jgi:hypothetical protein
LLQASDQKEAEDMMRLLQGEKLQRGADAAAMWMLRGYFEKRGCHDAADAAAADLFDVLLWGGRKVRTSELRDCKALIIAVRQLCLIKLGPPTPQPNSLPKLRTVAFFHSYLGDP